MQRRGQGGEPGEGVLRKEAAGARIVEARPEVDEPGGVILPTAEGKYLDTPSYEDNVIHKEGCYLGFWRLPIFPWPFLLGVSYQEVVMVLWCS